MPDDDALLAGLRRHFGFEAFRGKQRDVIATVLAGDSALAIFPTGEGKSLCYQLPALMLDGLTIVLSPLIALMQDQVDALRQRGIPATFINSSIDRATRERRLEDAVRGDVKLLYVTPERFRVPGFVERITEARIALLAVDEAHCVSQWGHDFRPDYARVGAIRERLGSPPVLALTATATPAVQRDVLDRLGAPNATTFHTGIERANLFLGVHPVANDEDKVDRIVERANEIGGPGIVYFALIRNLLEFEVELKRRGLEPLIYHGDLAPDERRGMQQRFMTMANPLILATNAFGMGVDKADIRFILHHQIPRTLEAYYQEVGRAGRDGRGSLCELLFCDEDVLIQKEFTEWANPGRDFVESVVHVLEQNRHRWPVMDVQDLRETLLIKNRRDGRVDTALNLLETAGCTRGVFGRGTFELVRAPDRDEIDSWIDDDKRERDLQHLLEMARYATAPGCRKSVLHEHFGFEPLVDGCGACDACVDGNAWLATHLPVDERQPIEGAGRRPEDGLARGDWIDIRHHGTGMVTQVFREGRRTRIEVELASTMRRRKFDLARIHWRRVEE